MSSHVTESRIYGGVYSDPEFAAVFSDSNQVQKWLDVERALALTQAELGLIPQGAAEEIARKTKVELFDLEQLGRESRETGHVLVPTIRALSKLCEDPAGEYVHYGVTTQDILDTGLILQVKEAWGHVLGKLSTIRQNMARLAERHKQTPMAARTHGQHALPTTFGYKVAVWVDELDRHLERFQEAESRIFVGNLTGAVGTMASFGAQGFEIQKLTLAKLGLVAPRTSWHSARDRILEIGGLLMQIAVTLGRIGKEIFNLQRTEIDEVREGFRMGKIGSSTMPHKQNPSTVDLIAALSRMIRAQMVALTDAAFQEHERDGTTWRIEWAALPEMFVYTGAILGRMDEVLVAGLEVREEQMRRNLDLLGGQILSERIMFVLGNQFGKQTAHEVVYEVAMEAKQHGIPFRDALRKDNRVKSSFTPQALEDLLDPATYLGLAVAMVDQVIRDGANKIQT
jgi:adenylosuccinate lyase